MNIYELKKQIDKLISGMSDEDAQDIQISMTLRDEYSNLISGTLGEITGIWLVNTSQSKPLIEMTLLGDIYYSDLKLEKTQTHKSTHQWR